MKRMRMHAGREGGSSCARVRGDLDACFLGEPLCVDHHILGQPILYTCYGLGYPPEPSPFGIRPARRPSTAWPLTFCNCQRQLRRRPFAAHLSTCRRMRECRAGGLRRPPFDRCVSRRRFIVHRHIIAFHFYHRAGAAQANLRGPVTRLL